MPHIVKGRWPTGRVRRPRPQPGQQINVPQLDGVVCFAERVWCSQQIGPLDPSSFTSLNCHSIRQCKSLAWPALGSLGIGSLAAAVIALRLARRVSKVSLQSWVGIRTTFGGSGPQQDVVSFSVTNVGERPVTISVIGWCIGKGKKKETLYSDNHERVRRSCSKKNRTRRNRFIYDTFVRITKLVRQLGQIFNRRKLYT